MGRKVRSLATEREFLPHGRASREDCGGNQMTVFFDSNKGSAQVCWRSSVSDDGEVHDLWLADGKERPLHMNACGFAEKEPFAALKKFGGAPVGGKPL